MVKKRIATKKFKNANIVRGLIEQLGKVFPSIAARSLYRNWFSVQGFAPRMAELALIKSSEQGEIEYSGKRIHYYRWQCDDHDRPSIVLVHGWSGRGTQAYAFIEPLLNAGFNVFAFDGPAHGNSSGESTHMGEFAECLIAISHKFGPFFGAITHSYGGAVVAYALKNGLSLDRMIAIATPAELSRAAEQFFATNNVPVKVIERFHRLVAARLGEHWWQDIAAIQNFSLIKIPVLLIHDKMDKEVPFSDALALQAACAQCRLLPTERLGHRKILGNEHVIKSAVEFLQQR